MLSRTMQALKKHRFALPVLLVRKFLAKFVRMETLVVYCHDLRGLRVLAAPDSAVHIVRIDEPDTESFRRLCLKYPAKKFHERLQQGQQCFLAVRNNQLAGYAWVTRNNDLYLDEIACTYPVASDEVFIYDCFVEADFRGAGIYPSMLAAAIHENSRMNNKLKRACIAASSINQASIRGILKVGFVEQKRIRYMEYRRKQKWWGLSPIGQVNI